MAGNMGTVFEDSGDPGRHQERNRARRAGRLLFVTIRQSANVNQAQDGCEWPGAGGGMKIITDDNCVAYAAAGHPERPARITMTVEKLRTQKDLRLDWAKPAAVTDTALLRAHTPDHLKRLNEPRDF